MRNVGISAKMTGGKTTVAKYLEQKYGFEIYNFAKPMKELEAIHRQFKKDKSMSIDELLEMLDPYIEKLNVPHKTASDKLLDLYIAEPLVEPKNRSFLQKIGTDIVRSLNNNAWVDYMLNYIKDIDKPVVVDDVRFTNEADILREAGFVVARINMDDSIRIPNVVRLYGEEQATHEKLNHTSEVDLDNYDKFDLVFKNTMDTNQIEQFGEEIYELAKKGR